MTVIFDLDYVLLDVKKFTPSLSEVFGLGEEEYRQSYNQHFPPPKKQYNAFLHISGLLAEGKISPARAGEIERGVRDILGGIDRFIFPRAEELLQYLKERNVRLVLFTYGDLVWQKAKMDNLSLGKYFDDIIFTDSDKEIPSRVLRDSPGETFIVNDNARELILMSGQVPGARTILIKGPYSRNCEHKMAERTIEDCFKLIS